MPSFVHKRIAAAAVLAVMITACTSLSLSSPSNPDSLLVSDEVSFESPKRVSRFEARRDIELLIYALTKGYGGRNYVDRDQLRAAVNKLTALGSSDSDTHEFCERIGESLASIQDMHLMARLDGKTCERARLGFLRKPSVGKNIQKDFTKPWEINHIDLGEKKIPVISITSLPKSEENVWKGFLDQVRRLRGESDAVIFDLRGNEGGDDTTGKLVAEIFYGQNFPSLVHAQVKSQVPETYALLINNYLLRILRLKEKKKDVPEFWFRRLEKGKQNYQNAKERKIPIESEEVIEQGPPFDSSKGYSKPILLLVDAACASSCESIIDFFENHPFAKTIGENTGGFVHFGNMGFVMLPSSVLFFC